MKWILEQSSDQLLWVADSKAVRLWVPVSYQVSPNGLADGQVGLVCEIVVSVSFGFTRWMDGAVGALELAGMLRALIDSGSFLG